MQLVEQIVNACDSSLSLCSAHGSRCTMVSYPPSSLRQVPGGGETLGRPSALLQQLVKLHLKLLLLRWRPYDTEPWCRTRLKLDAKLDFPENSRLENVALNRAKSSESAVLQIIIRTKDEKKKAQEKATQNNASSSN